MSKALIERQFDGFSVLSMTDLRRASIICNYLCSCDIETAICYHCNTSLGHMCEDVERLQSAIIYLETSRGSTWKL